MKKLSFLIPIFCFIAVLVNAQQMNDREHKKFKAAENLLVEHTNNFRYDSLDFETRVAHIHQFIPKFVAILKEKNSFYYPFDSLNTIMKVYAPDSSFRIFTWQLKDPLGTHKYYGALQRNTKNLALIPLFDYSDTMVVHPQNVLNATNWYGGLYYNCLQHEVDGKKYYTLLAFDDADFVSNRKFIEILHFDEEDKPIFGAPLFSFTDSNNVTIVKNRFFLEYDDRASVKLNYDESQEKIIYDHLVPPSDKEKDAYFIYIPDGTYEGLEWDGEKWIWVEKIFHYSIGKPDSPPMPKPILDNRD